MTWLEADFPPGVTPQFKIVITNNGNVTLTNITVTDTTFGTIGTLASLAPGATVQFIVP